MSEQSFLGRKRLGLKGARSNSRSDSRVDALALRVKTLGLAMRKPRKISVTIPQSLYEELVPQCEVQGRSLSSLASYWLQLQASLGDRGRMKGLHEELAQAEP